MSRLDRQSFLGADSEAVLAAATIGIVGLGGGGSHIAQQAAHMGIGGYVNTDPDVIEETNTNRLVGGTLRDVIDRRLKVAIAERLIRELQPGARVLSLDHDWRAAADDLKQCDAIVGCLDSFKEREQLERLARKHLIPYLDVGMDVHDLGAQGFLVSGQVFLSTPGYPCMRCCDLITEERLGDEARRYGSAGSRPQVIWANGVLASTAVGLLTQILAAWYPNPPQFVYLDFDGNKGTVTPNKRMMMLKDWVCPHHPPDEVGSPLFDIRVHEFAPRAVTLESNTPASWWGGIVHRLRSATSGRWRD